MKRRQTANKQAVILLKQRPANTGSAVQCCIGIKLSNLMRARTYAANLEVGDVIACLTVCSYARLGPWHW
jgi:hypothetical protein